MESHSGLLRLMTFYIIFLIFHSKRSTKQFFLKDFIGNLFNFVPDSQNRGSKDEIKYLKRVE